LGHLCDLIDFATEMTGKLEEINKHSFNNFQLRIGVAVGALGMKPHSTMLMTLSQDFIPLFFSFHQINPLGLVICRAKPFTIIQYICISKATGI
jgi:hypothetical protein